MLVLIGEPQRRLLDPTTLSDERRGQLQSVLRELFGTPAKPTIADDQADGLVPNADALAAGGLVYKRHCLQCHGLTGDGRGPTGPWVYPMPRDFRQGVYKYVSSAGSAARKPRRDDVRRLLRHGIDRTSMPSFALLPDDERERAIDYAIYLSIRGEVEFRLLRELLVNDEPDDGVAAEARRMLRLVLAQWRSADDAPMIASADDDHAWDAPARQESIRRGHALFVNPAINCAGCHEDYGRKTRYLHDVWGSAVRVPDLTEGVFHGGKRPLDLFHRVRGGIGPSGMPAAASLTDQQVWDLVHFVLALPTPSLLPPDVNHQVRDSR
jgi:mono/diheme cytochrome c family protein